MEEVAADEVEPDDVEPTTTDDMMPDAAESGFAFDPAEALRVYDTSLIQDETLRGNVEQRLEEMGCARREDGKLEMPIKSSFDEWMANLSKTDEHSLDKEEKKAYKVIIETIQHLKSHLLEIPMRRAETIMNDIRERWIWLDNRLTEDWCEKHQLPEEEQSVINYSVKDKSIETIVERAVKCFQKIIPNDVAKFVNGITFMVAADNEEERLASCCLPDGKTIKVAPGENILGVLHELAHALELRSPEIERKCIEFLKKRTDGKELVSLKEWTLEEYDDDEKAWKDDFCHPYIGKAYLDDNGKIVTTEILSQGIELLIKRSNWFFSQDNEHCKLTYKLLRGLDLQGESNGKTTRQFSN